MTTITPSEQTEDLAAGGAASAGMGRVSRRLAWASVALTASLSLVTILLSMRYVSVTGDFTSLISHQAITPFSAIVFSALGALVVSQRPRNPIGYIFLIVGLFEGISSLASGYALFGPPLWNREPVPGEALANWLNLWIWMPAIFLPVTLVFLLFPTGKLPSHRWRPVAWLTVLALAAVIAGRALHPGPGSGWGDEINPIDFGLPAAVPAALLNAGTIILLAAMAAAIVALIGRFRRSRGIEREQLKWLVYAGLMMVLGFVVTAVLWYGFPRSRLVEELSIALTGGMVLLIAIATGIAIARHQLYDIDLIINRTLVYALLTAAIVVIYVLLVGGAGALLQSQSNWLVALVATGVVAVLFQPLRQRLQKWVNRLLYGQRDEPFEVLSDLGQRLEGTLSADMVYPTLVETVAQTLKLPFVAIAVQRDDGLETAVSYGKPVSDAIGYPLTYQGETIGLLEVAPRAPGESLSTADERLLENIARQAGTAVHAVQLTEDLQRSRRQLVTAREEERRRLRRDLHDGLGPSLAALHLQSGVLRRLISTDPQAAEALADEFRGDIRATIDDIRRVVYELRPPALDELGLAAAVRSQAQRWPAATEDKKRKTGDFIDGGVQPDGTEGDEVNAAAPQVTVEAPESLPLLPAAVEVAAYRIVQEALANVAHHAQAQHCSVRLVMNGEADDACLVVEIVDDGAGLNGRGRENGLGLLSMRERAEELGGHCTITSLPEGGTRVWAELPLY